MKVFAKCHNCAGCLQAYRGEEVELPSGAPLVCPECGKQLVVTKAAPAWIWKAVPLLIVLTVIATAVVLGAPLVSKLLKKERPAPAAAGAEVSSQTASTGSPQGSEATGSISEQTSSEPPETVTAPAQIDMNLAKAENRQVKDEVLKRIDLMPNVSSANKDKLYNSVERARSMGKVLTVPFNSGRMTLGVAEAQALKEALAHPEIVKLREDPTAVFVVLGYADPKGDPKKNLAISQARADAVREAMRDRAGVNNLTHSVAMGGTTLVDAKNLEKNRIVEIWAVLP